MAFDNSFRDRATRLPEKPRRVRGGVRLAGGKWPEDASWPASAWVAALTAAAAPEVLERGFSYARSGQTRSISIEPGRISADIQGPADRPYRTTLDLPRLTPEQWEAFTQSLAAQALFGAKLLAGELPREIETLLAPLGVSLAPRPGEMRAECTCAEPGPFCTHVSCAALLAGEMLEGKPFLIFTLRGMPPETLLERLSMRRSAAAGRAGGASLPPPAPPGIHAASRPLEDSIGSFWDAGAALEQLETPMRGPEVGHALLRRLGPSPLAEGRFPLVGLLATCYDLISEATLKDSAAESQRDEPAH